MFWNFILFYFIKVEADPRLQYKNERGPGRCHQLLFQQICEKNKIPVAITFQMKQGQNCHVILLCKIRQQKSQTTTVHHEVNNSLFNCMSILSDLRQRKNPRALCQGVPQFHLFPRSHRNIYFLQNGKEVRKSKESCLQKGRFPYLCVLLRFENTLWFMPLDGPPSGEHTCTRTSPTTNYLKIMQRSI